MFMEMLQQLEESDAQLEEAHLKNKVNIKILIE